MSAFTPRNREDVIRHLDSEHGWNDGEAWPHVRRVDVVSAGGFPIIPTDELLVIHFELTRMEEEAKA